MTQLRTIKTLFAGMLALGAVAASPVASAVTVSWTDWTNIGATSAVGNMGGVAVTVTATSGNIDVVNGVSQTGSGTNYWTEPAPGPAAYTSGTVSNAPTPSEQVALNNPVAITVTFSTPVSGLYMALLSVGRSSLPVTYDFDQAFTVDSEGRGYWGDGTYTAVPGDGILTGSEFHGVLRFAGPISTLSFTTSPNEFWHAFTFGVPEPGMLALLGLGLLGAGVARRRRPA